MCERCEVPLSKEARAQYELYKALNWGFLYGRAGEGKNYAAAQKVRENLSRMRRGEALQCKYINGKHIVGYLKDEGAVKLPQKVCNYRKPKVHWFGELHDSNNYIWNDGFVRSSHWLVGADRLTIKGRDPKDGLSVFFDEYKDESLEMANSYEDDFYRLLGDDIESFKGKRFIGISEPTESEQFDSSFMKKITGDVWAETRTLDVSSKSWVPQGQIFIGGSKPLKINEKSKETIERVKDITYP